MPLPVKNKEGDLTQLRLGSCGEILKNTGNVRIQHKVVKNQTLNKIERYTDNATIFYNGKPLNESTKAKVLWGIATVLTLGLMYGVKRAVNLIQYKLADTVDEKNIDLIKTQTDFVYKCTNKEIDKVVNAWKKRENQHKPLPTGLTDYISKNLKDAVKNVSYSTVDEQIKLLKTHLTSWDTNPVQDIFGKKITPENIKKEMEVYREARKTLLAEGYL